MSGPFLVETMGALLALPVKTMGRTRVRRVWFTADRVGSTDERWVRMLRSIRSIRSIRIDAFVGEASPSGTSRLDTARCLRGLTTGKGAGRLGALGVASRCSTSRTDGVTLRACARGSAHPEVTTCRRGPDIGGATFSFPASHDTFTHHVDLRMITRSNAHVASPRPSAIVRDGRGSRARGVDAREVGKWLGMDARRLQDIDIDTGWTEAHRPR